MVCKLQELVKDTSHPVTDDLCDAIRNAIPQLIQLLDDPDRHIRHGVIRAMTTLVDNGL
jgi:hypothetical protein